MSGLSTTGNISLGIALVAGKKRVPKPATGKTAFLIFIISPLKSLTTTNHQPQYLALSNKDARNESNFDKK
jgi:hypothetical protein